MRFEAMWEVFLRIPSPATPSPRVEQDFSSGFQTPQFYAAVIAALAALTAAIISVRSAKALSRKAERQREIDFLRQQLNELYGHVYMLRRASESLRSLLPDKDSDGNRWRLVDHIEEIKADKESSRKNAVKEILQIGKEIEDILTSKAGLLETFPPPTSYTVFIAHSRNLRLSWSQGMNQSEKTRLPFPLELDGDLEKDIAAIYKRLEQLGARDSSSK